ncbi:heme biosynthesis HemY N-terminal domain-containing protein [Alteromonas sp. CYL-A6]|uniref:heme biosynthesis HemY N-terminal domain-containing protein n=1 Tax=Alteromonas nitratireducens TaxID=3390813 RepID=UPI0034AD0F91
MKWLVYALLLVGILIAAMIVAPMILGDSGYVLITLGDTAIEMTVISLVISVIALAIAWWVIKRLALRLLSLFTGSHRWFGVLGQIRREKAFYQGIQALAEGQSARALTLLSKTSNGDFDGVNYLAAAQAAIDEGEPVHARRMLEMACDYDNARVAATMMKGRLLTEQGHSEEALALLNALDEDAQKHAGVIGMKARLMAQLGHWEELEHKLGEWRKHLSKSQYVSWSQRIAKGKFAEIASKQGANALKQYWETLPRKMRADTAYRAAFIQQLLEQGMHNDAQQRLLEWQKGGPDAVLFGFFKALNLPNAAPTVQQLEKWIKHDPENASLYSTLGNVAHNAGDDVLAEKALLKAIKLSPNQHDLMVLSQISENRQDPKQALSFVKQGMLLSQKA